MTFVMILTFINIPIMVERKINITFATLLKN
jgi:hypothetical protein